MVFEVTNDQAIDPAKVLDGLEDMNTIIKTITTIKTITIIKTIPIPKSVRMGDRARTDKQARVGGMKRSDLLETTFSVRIRSIGSNSRWGDRQIRQPNMKA